VAIDVFNRFCGKLCGLTWHGKSESHEQQSIRNVLHLNAAEPGMAPYIIENSPLLPLTYDSIDGTH
jgi:hypothetical protein